MRLPFIPWSIAGVPSSQALPGFFITAPTSVCVPDVLGALAVWIQNHTKKNYKVAKVRHSHSLLAPVVVFSLAHICGLGLCLFLMRWYCQDG